jgi:ADP-ribose diphosphatase
MAPAFFDAKMAIFIAEDLYPEVLPGDEPEPLEVVKWSIHDVDALLAKDDFVEARCIAALLLAQRWWKAR